MTEGVGSMQALILKQNISFTLTVPFEPIGSSTFYTVPPIFQVREDLLQSLRFPSRLSVHPSTTIFPEFIDELKQCRQASGTPQIAYFMKADDVNYPNSDKNTNTNTNTETNTKTNTKTDTAKGKT